MILSSTKSYNISLILLLATIACITIISRRGEPMVIKTNLERIPMEIAGFKATEDYFSDAVYKELNADKHVYRHYRSDDGRQVDLYIGYYGTAKGGRTPHNPYACLPSSGWGIIATDRVKVKDDYSKKEVELNYILSQKDEYYDTVIHWYQSDGDKVLPSGFKRNIQRFLGRIFYNKNDGAFVRVSVTSNKEGIDDAKRLGVFFSEKVLSLLPEYWPLER